MCNAIIPYAPEWPTMWGLWWWQVISYSCTNLLDLQCYVATAHFCITDQDTSNVIYDTSP